MHFGSRLLHRGRLSYRLPGLVGERCEVFGTPVGVTGGDADLGVAHDGLASVLAGSARRELGGVEVACAADGDVGQSRRLQGFDPLAAFDGVGQRGPLRVKMGWPSGIRCSVAQVLRSSQRVVSMGTKRMPILLLGGTIHMWGASWRA